MMMVKHAVLVLALVCGAARAEDDLGGAWVTPDVLRTMKRAEAREKKARERLWREAIREDAVALQVPARVVVLERLEAMAEDAGPPLPDGQGVPVAPVHAAAVIGPPASPRPPQAHAAVREFREMRTTRDTAPDDLEARPAHEYLQSMAETTTAPAIVARVKARRAPPAPAPKPEPVPAPYRVPPAVHAAVLVPVAPRPPAIPPPAFVAETARAQQRTLGSPRPKTRATKGSLFDWRTRDNKSKGRRSLDNADL
jgi:hypothetical protein